MRSRAAKAAAVLMGLAFVPLTVLAATPVRASPPFLDAPQDLSSLPLFGTTGFDAPTVDALLRAWQSGLFGSFGWDGFVVRGSFVQFSFDIGTGEISSYLARRGTENLAVLGSIDLVPEAVFASTDADGPLFTATSDSVMVTAHDGPSALLSIRTGGDSRQVILHFIDSITNVTAQATSAAWPHAELSFSVGDTRGRLLLGSGSFNVTGATVVANLTPNDMLAMRILPAFANDKPARMAILDAFASGRLAAEFALVAKSGGGWVETSARFRRNLMSSSASVAEGNASVHLGSTRDQGGLVLLAFDPRTMPVHGTHELVVLVNGTEIPEVADMTGTFYSTTQPQDRAYYMRLPMNATVVAVYLPSFGWSTVQVRSLETALPPADVLGAEIAAAAAVGIVSVAAGVMFRRRTD